MDHRSLARTNRRSITKSEKGVVKLPALKGGVEGSLPVKSLIESAYDYSFYRIWTLLINRK